MIKIFIVFFSVIFLFSCGASSSEKKKERSLEPVFPVTVDLGDLSTKQEGLKLSEIAERIDYVPLETTDSCLLSSFWRFHISDSFLFVKVEGGIYSFKTSGEFVAHFPFVGRGPGEEYVRCFTVDEKNKLIYFIGNYTYKWYAYTFDGRWTRKTFSWPRSDLYVTSLFCWDGKLFGINKIDPKNDMFSLGIDLSTNKTVFKYPCPYVLPEELQKKRLVGWIAGEYMMDYQNYNDSLLLYRDIYSDTLWQTSDLLTRSPRYVFKWDEIRKLSYEEDLGSLTSWNKKEYERIMNKLSGKMNLIYPIETSHFLFFKITGYSPPVYGIYEKYSRVVHLYSHGEHSIIENNMDGGPDVVPYPNFHCQWIYKDKLYNLIWPYEFLEHKSEVPRSAAVEQLYRTVKENDNPILMIVTLKK